MIDELRHDHDRLRAIAAQLRTLLKDDGARIGLCFAAARWSFTRELLRHMAMEKQFLREHDLAAAAVSEHSPYHADTFERRYREHLARWTAMEIDAHWPEYCRDLRDILNVLEHRMQFEERAVFPRTRRQAAPAPRRS